MLAVLARRGRRRMSVRRFPPPGRPARSRACAAAGASALSSLRSPRSRMPVSVPAVAAPASSVMSVAVPVSPRPRSRSTSVAPPARWAAATHRVLAGRVQRVGRVERVAHRRRLDPVVAGAAGLLVEVAGELAEGGLVLARGVDLEQLQLHVLALGILGERFLQYFLGLPVAPVGDIDLGLRQRIDFVGGGGGGSGCRCGGGRLRSWRLPPPQRQPPCPASGATGGSSPASARDGAGAPARTPVRPAARTPPPAPRYSGSVAASRIWSISSGSCFWGRAAALRLRLGFGLRLGRRASAFGASASARLSPAPASRRRRFRLRSLPASALRGLAGSGFAAATASRLPLRLASAWPGVRLRGGFRFRLGAAACCACCCAAAMPGLFSSTSFFMSLMVFSSWAMRSLASVERLLARNGFLFQRAHALRRAARLALLARSAGRLALRQPHHILRLALGRLVLDLAW